MTWYVGLGVVGAIFGFMLGALFANWVWTEKDDRKRG